MTIEREKYLARLKDSAEKSLLARAFDLAEAALQRDSVEVTDFFDPYHAGLFISAVTSLPGLGATAGGGYAGAERVRVAIHREESQPGPEDFSLVFLSVEGNFKLVHLSHRDFLGSLLGLGLKRDKLGDIMVDRDGAVAVVVDEVAHFIMANLNKVGRVRVSVRPVTEEDIRHTARDFKEICATVSSLRLDAIAAAGFSTSRTRVTEVIRSGLVSVNWRVCANNATPVRKGDMISIRGRGRAEVAEVTGPLKSGRMGIVLKKYI